MHPLIPFEPKGGAQKAGSRILITAGELDPVAPVEMTQALADYFKHRGDEVILEWHPGGHEIRQNEIGAAKRFLSSRSEEHTSELQSLMRISYAVFCLKKKRNNNTKLHQLVSKKTLY